MLSDGFIAFSIWMERKFKQNKLASDFSMKEVNDFGVSQD